MLKNNFKKAFTLAELMVVLAIIWILSAWAMNIFTWAIAEARDSNRVTDLNVMKSALESYYIKHKVYPQPAKQTEENVWGFVDQNAVATCWVALDSTTWEIDSKISSNKCGWKIVINEKKVEEITCKYWYKVSGAEVNNEFNLDLTDEGLNIWDIYEFDNLKDNCVNYISLIMKKCDDDTENSWGDYTCEDDNDLFGVSEDVYEFYKNWTSIEDIVLWTLKTYSASWSRENLIWWKWTLTEKSWVNSIHEDDEEKIKKAFYGFMQDTWVDPKYKNQKYTDFWFGFYPYSVFRDWAWDSASKTYIWWTSYQIAATLEKQDEDWNYNPETLIIWNYKRPKNSDTWKIKKWYPRSLFWNWTDVIVNEQKEWEKAKYVKKPNWSSNRWIPYPVEEIE